MLSKTFGLLFYLKKPKNYAKGNMPVYMRITIDTRRVEIAAKREWDAARWNPSAGRATGTKEDAKVLNAYLDVLQTKVYEAQRLLLMAGEIVSPEKLKNELLGITERPRTILEVFREHNEQVDALVGNEYAPLTAKRYRTALWRTEEFIQWKFKQSDREITKLNYEFITDFEFYLKSVRKCGHNSAMKYITNFRKVVNICIKKGWLNRDPFYGFKKNMREVVRDFLSQEELDTIAGKGFSIERLDAARDIFLFSCYSGLAYVDVFNLKRDNISTGVDGEQWIMACRQKTEVPTRIPLLGICKDIIEKYQHHPKCCNEKKLLPVTSNQKMNAYLKEIADVCGIKKILTFHLARHTFATTVTLNNGVPIETVSKMLGHRSLRTTQHYAKLQDRRVSEDMQALKLKLGVKTVPALRVAQ
jgi:site-specific recombinase XerD